MSVKVARYEKTSGPVSVVKISDPMCPDDGVVIAVKATGICRSDWHAWHGREHVDLPHVGGHEYAGEIAEIGRDVAGFTVGERVTVPFVCGCGQCEYCRSGNAQVCPHQQQPGFDLPGSFAERVAVPAAVANLVRLPDEVSAEAAASLGCRFATAFRAITAHGRVQPGQWVAVHGCGGVGLSAIMIARAFGAAVVAVDTSDAALAAATRLGAEQTINASDLGDATTIPGAIGAAVYELTSGGAHVSVDALGSAGTAVASVKSLRRRGRHIQVGLLHGSAVHPPIPMDRVIGWELEIYGSHGMPAVDYPAMLAMVTDGRLRPQELITHTIDLTGITAALHAMDTPTSAGMTICRP